MTDAPTCPKCGSEDVDIHGDHHSSEEETICDVRAMVKEAIDRQISTLLWHGEAGPTEGCPFRLVLREFAPIAERLGQFSLADKARKLGGA